MSFDQCISFSYINKIKAQIEIATFDFKSILNVQLNLTPTSNVIKNILINSSNHAHRDVTNKVIF